MGVRGSRFTIAQSTIGAMVLGQRTEQPRPVPDAGALEKIEGREADSAPGQVLILLFRPSQRDAVLRRPKKDQNNHE